MLDIGLWVIAGLAILIAVVAYLRTPAEERGAVWRAQPIDAQLKRYPASARAVIIKAQPKRALLRALPIAVLALALVRGMEALKHGGMATLCERFGAEMVLQWTLWSLSYGAPGVFAAVTVMSFPQAIRIWTGGYAPPLDSVLLHDTVAVSGWRARVRSLVVLVGMPLMSTWAIWLGNDVHRAFRPRLSSPVAAHCPVFGEHRGNPNSQRTHVDRHQSDTAR